VALTVSIPAIGLIAFAPRLAYAATLPGERRPTHIAAAATGAILCAATWVLISASGAIR
jgi:hypothetical protein